MNYFVSFLLQLPLYCVLMSGLEALSGLSVWWCMPICGVAVLSYDIGEMIKREGTDETTKNQNFQNPDLSVKIFYQNR